MNRSLISLLILLLFSSYMSAQSDFKIVEKFKSSVSAFERELNSAAATDQINLIKKNIEEFKRNYLEHKDLLDGALYPENFNSTFKKLDAKIKLAYSNIGEKEILEDEIVQLEEKIQILKQQIGKLTKENGELFEKIKILSAGREAGHNVVDSLNRVIVQLKNNIIKRDALIAAIIDSIFTPISHRPATLNDIEKKEISGRVRNANLLTNIKIMILDNIHFIAAAEITGAELAELREEYDNFDIKWQMIGGQLVDVYADSKKKKAELQDIESLKTQWDQAFDDKIWSAIDELIAVNNLEIDPFGSGAEFYASISKFLDDEINDVYNRSESEKRNIYSRFVIDVWDDNVAEYWLPLMLDRNYISEAEAESLTSKINEWDSKIGTFSSPMTTYAIILAVLIIAIIFVFYFAFKPRKKV